MCGICGIANLTSDFRVESSQLRIMCRAMQHRGPDDEGLCVDNGVGIAMRRLSIIDLSGGKQPISNEDGSITLVCNGEIYTYPQLRKSLEHHGHIFKTGSDVESIIHAYEEYGEDFLQFINGMFAFALWDRRARKLLLGRDRAGIKPLYYTFQNNTLAFSSELKSLIALPSVARDLDYLAVNQYLSFEYVPAPRTIFKNINKLPPGHVLELTSQGISIKKYWDLSFERSETRPPLGLSELKEQLLETFEHSVKLEMLSDVPLGVFLSGGLDSSAVAAMAMRATSAPLKTFTLKFEDASFDESDYAAQVARHLGTEHHVQTVTPQMVLDTIAEVPSVIDEPFGDSSIIPTLLLSKFARQHVKVALGGDGGDELFAGYPTLQAHRLVEIYERLVPFSVRAHAFPRIVKSLPVSFNNISFDFKAKRFLMGRGVPTAIRHQIWLGSFTENEKATLLHPDLHYREIDSYSILHEHLRQTDARNPYNQLLYCDFKLYLEGDILAKVDRASMYHSLEVRVPLLNLAMLRFVSTLPFNFKLRRFTSKYLFKKSMEGILPRNIIWRSKKGFNIPVGKLFQRELKEMLGDYLSPSRLERQGFFAPQTVQRMVDEHLQQKADHRKQLWTLLMFQKWYEHTVEQPSVESEQTTRPVSIAVAH